MIYCSIMYHCMWLLYPESSHFCPQGNKYVGKCKHSSQDNLCYGVPQDSALSILYTQSVISVRSNHFVSHQLYTDDIQTSNENCFHHPKYIESVFLMINLMISNKQQMNFDCHTCCSNTFWELSPCIKTSSMLARASLDLSQISTVGKFSNKWCYNTWVLTGTFLIWLL